MERRDDMKQILFATKNPAKVRRFREKLRNRGIDMISLNEKNISIEVEENGKDAISNALMKARAYYETSGMTTIAMDDNLYLENVPEDLQPGVFVRRIQNKRLNDEEMIRHYVNLVKQYGTEGKLIGKWVYGLAVIKNGIEKTYTWSKEDFYIVDTPTQKRNPGYPLNSISIHKKLNKYFTDLTEEDKKQTKEEELDVIDFICENV